LVVPIGDLILESATFTVSGEGFSTSGIIDLSERTIFHTPLGVTDPVGHTGWVNRTGTVLDGEENADEFA
jgi:hypothetical protein